MRNDFNLDSLITLNVTPNTGTLELNDLDFSYYGNIGYNITGYCINSTDTISQTLFADIFWSNFSFSLAETENWWQNPSANATSYNVTPWGQNSTQPIFNFTMMNYAGQMNLSIKLNETFNRINITANVINNQSTGTILSTSYYQFGENLSRGDITGLFTWTDYFDVNATDVRFFDPIFDVRSCCYECMPCYGG